MRRELIWLAHREHLYQRLVIAGFSHPRVAVIYGVFAAVTSSTALLLVQGSGNFILVIVGFVIVISAFFTFIVSKKFSSCTSLDTPHGA